MSVMKAREDAQRTRVLTGGDGVSGNFAPAEQSRLGGLEHPTRHYVRWWLGSRTLELTVGTRGAWF